MGPFEKQIEANFTETAVVEASRHAVPSVGDRVQYAKTFLRSIAAGPTDRMWFARGKLKSIAHTFGPGRELGVVEWEKDETGKTFPPKIMTTGLVKTGTNEG